VKILAIDTSTLTASAAVVIDGEAAAAEAMRTGGATASEEIMPLIARVMERAGVAPRELDAVAVGAGPGSFTGLRIGMATAKGIAFSAGVPLWMASSLAALTLAAVRSGVTGLVVPVLDARRGEIYVGLPDGERVMPPGELRLDGPATLIGDAFTLYPQLRALGAVIEATPGAVEVALAAVRTDVLSAGAPVYIRPSEAEVMYPDGIPGALKKPR
jgi:tRNA threonylcarbamoyladenosine biosynthesis protein TsaB